MQILQIQNHDFGTSRIRAILRNLLASRGREITMFGKDRFASAGFCQTHPVFVGMFNPIFKQKIKILENLFLSYLKPISIKLGNPCLWLTS